MNFLRKGTVYVATLKGGSSGIKDSNNNGLDTDYTWQFTTQTNQAPDTPYNPQPTNDEEDISIGTNLIGMILTLIMIH